MSALSSPVIALTSAVCGIVLTGALALPRVVLALVQLSEPETPATAHAPLLPSARTSPRGGEGPRRTAFRALVLALLAPSVLMISTIPGWPKDKPTRFWNLTGDTVTHLALAPAGTDAYGPDQCANDRDGTVDFDERLPITGVAPGRYDIRLDLRKGRRCRVRDVEIQAGEVFSVEAGDLADCPP